MALSHTTDGELIAYVNIDLPIHQQQIDQVYDDLCSRHAGPDYIPKWLSQAYITHDGYGSFMIELETSVLDHYRSESDLEDSIWEDMLNTQTVSNMMTIKHYQEDGITSYDDYLTYKSAVVDAGYELDSVNEILDTITDDVSPRDLDLIKQDLMLIALAA